MSYKLLCTDIDGTLLNAERELAPETISEFLRIKNGCDIILASSRMPDAMRHLQRDVDILDSPMIAYNGGLVLDGIKVLSSTEVGFQEVKKIVEFSLGTEIHVSIYNNDEWFVPGMDYWANREASNTKVTPSIQSLDDTLGLYSQTNKGAHKVMCMGPSEQISVLYNNLIQYLNDDLHVYKSKDTYLEIASKRISKKSAIATLLENKYKELDWHQIIAFGDNYNDIEMLEAVGVGVAVGNAKDEVLAIANDITATNKEHGVALSMAKYFI
ncbi:Cof-type HAD-IIB family hydrolase [Bacteroidia bacterium]|nr:Cof-type HAD-IIB family hydrolase [Bacteroidia bacterium]MDC1394950.1 Cof-type HAD-IIB family hydrolase [Bacteroidia bacterium]